MKFVENFYAKTIYLYDYELLCRRFVSVETR